MALESLGSMVEGTRRAPASHFFRGVALGPGEPRQSRWCFGMAKFARGKAIWAEEVYDVRAAQCLPGRPRLCSFWADPCRSRLLVYAGTLARWLGQVGASSSWARAPPSMLGCLRRAPRHRRHMVLGRAGWSELTM